MSEIKLEHGHYAGFPYIRFEGDLTVSTFTALHYAVRGATKLGTMPVVVDLSGELNISTDVQEIKCWRYPPEIPDYAKKVTLILVGTAERIEQIRSLLTPHDLQHALSLQGAIELVNKKQRELSG
ncbi:MAG TPA: hypothetical protein VE439_10915 [Anaerolineae bacterium]|jgi:hypothetical protein|nr:hypothetical protein [Anaerolineae bacterium]